MPGVVTTGSGSISPVELFKVKGVKGGTEYTPPNMKVPAVTGVGNTKPLFEHIGFG